MQGDRAAGGRGLEVVSVFLGPSWLEDSPALPRGRAEESEAWRRVRPRGLRLKGGGREKESGITASNSGSRLEGGRKKGCYRGYGDRFVLVERR